MQIGPETIDIDDLPRARFGGLRPEVVEDLFRRVQWNYAQLEFELKKLKTTLEQQPLPQFEQPGDRQSELATSFEPAEERPLEQPAPIEEPPRDLAPRVGQAEGRLVEQRPRTEPDELGRLFLAAALQAAREERESARHDADLMLKKARARTVELNREFEQAKALRQAELTERELEFEDAKVLRESELARLDVALREIRTRIRSALTSIVPVGPVAEPAIGNDSKPNQTDEPEVELPSQALLAGNGNTAAEVGSEPAPLAHSER